MTDEGRRLAFNAAAKGITMLGGFALTYAGVDYALSQNPSSALAAFNLMAVGMAAGIYSFVSVFPYNRDETLAQSLKKDRLRKGIFSLVAGAAIGGLAAWQVSRELSFEKEWAGLSKNATTQQAARYCSGQSPGHRMIVHSGNDAYKLICPAPAMRIL